MDDKTPRGVAYKPRIFALLFLQPLVLTYDSPLSTTQTHDNMLLSILLVSLFTAVSTVTALPNKQLDDPLGLANVYNEARSVPANEVEARQTWIPCGKAYSARNMIPLSARLGSPVCTYWAGDHGLTQYVMAPQGHKVEPCLCWFFMCV
jgi:hypothetical protein